MRSVAVRRGSWARRRRGRGKHSTCDRSMGTVALVQTTLFALEMHLGAILSVGVSMVSASIDVTCASQDGPSKTQTVMRATDQADCDEKESDSSQLNQCIQ